MLETEEYSEVGAFVGFEVADFFVVEEDLTLCYFVRGVSHDYFTERGFAGSVWSHDDMNFAGFYGQVEAFDDFLSINFSVKVLDF